MFSGEKNTLVPLYNKKNEIYKIMQINLQGGYYANYSGIKLMSDNETI